MLRCTTLIQIKLLFFFVQLSQLGDKAQTSVSPSVWQELVQGANCVFIFVGISVLGFRSIEKLMYSWTGQHICSIGPWNDAIFRYCRGYLACEKHVFPLVYSGCPCAKCLELCYQQTLQWCTPHKTHEYPGSPKNDAWKTILSFSPWIYMVPFAGDWIFGRWKSKGFHRPIPPEKSHLKTLFRDQLAVTITFFHSPDSRRDLNNKWLSTVNHWTMSLEKHESQSFLRYQLKQ